MQRIHPWIPRRKYQHQQGVALFVVIVFVMLSMLLALWASRTAWFNELVVGNNADYQRAFEAAQALLQDAELDIRGETPDGKQCNAQPCRAFMPAIQFPTEGKDINPVIEELMTKNDTGRCKDGLCARRVGRQDFWNYNKDSPKTITPNAAQGEVKLEELTRENVGARYGQFTGAQLGSNNKPANLILTERTEGKGGWYWIEILPYRNPKQSGNLISDGNRKHQLLLNLDVYIVYRITAIAYGRKPNTLVVLQETYARQRKKD